MNTLRFLGNWSILKGLLKQGWARITGNDRRYLRGREQEFCGRMQRCIGRLRDRPRHHRGAAHRHRRPCGHTSFRRRFS